MAPGRRSNLQPGTASPGAGSAFRKRVPAVVAQLAPLRHALSDWVAAVGMSGDAGYGLVLAGYEAMTNVVEHAYGDGGGTLDVEACLLPPGDRVAVVVSDRGHWRPPAPGLRLLGGRGLSLIEALADEVAIDRTHHGTTVRMYWRIAAAAQGGETAS